MDVTLATYVMNGLTGIVIITLVVYLLLAIACWRIYKKAGEPGWKAFIPIYNEYILFKIGWKTKMFWISLALLFAGTLVMALDPGTVTYYSYSTASVALATPSFISYIGLFVVLAGYIISVYAYYKLGCAFGHGIPFFIFALILPNFALLYLGFNGDEYQGSK